jgi:hypothetical protein
MNDLVASVPIGLLSTTVGFGDFWVDEQRQPSPRLYASFGSCCLTAFLPSVTVTE